MGKTTKVGLAGVFVLLLAAAFVWMSPAGADEDFELDPGYIQGTMTVPGYTLRSGQVSVGAVEPDGTYHSAGTQIEDSAYHLVVESGPWEYEMHLSASYEDAEGAFSLRRYATVGAFETVTENVHLGATVSGDVTITGAEVDKVTMEVKALATPRESPAYRFATTCHFPDASTYHVPVVGGGESYVVTLLSVSFPEYRAALVNLGAVEVEIAEGDSANVDFTFPVGFLSGQVTVNGATINPPQTWISAAIPSTAGKATSGFQIQPDGSFLIPMIPGTGGLVSGTIRTDRGDFDLGSTAFDIVAGETSELSWEFDAEPVGTVAGAVSVEGVELTQTRVVVGKYAYQQFLGGEGPYVIENVLAGEQRVLAILSEKRMDDEWYRQTTYYTIHEYVEVPEAGTVTQDFTLQMGFLEVDILAPDSPGIDDLVSAGVSFQGTYFSAGERLSTSNRDYIRGDGFEANTLTTWATPGAWRPWEVSATFEPANPQGEAHARLTIRESLGDSSLPSATVTAAETAELALGYETAKIIAHLRVVGGTPLSRPVVSAVYLAGPDGTMDKELVSTTGWTEAEDVVEGTVILYAIPGTYRLTGRGTVDGTTTTFGSIELTVGAGDVVDIDLTGPIVTLSTPEAGAQLHASTVLVSGTVTDDTGVATLQIDGHDVAFDPVTGYFEYVLTGLARGENTFTVTAVDLLDNQTSVSRAVTVVNTGPEAGLTCPETVEATGPGGATVVLDGSDSYDPDGDAIVCDWWVDGEYVGQGEFLYPVLSLGEHVVELRVTDVHGEFGTASATVTVVDTTPPEVSVDAVTPGSLWPPDHQMHTVSLALIVSDLVDPDAECRIVSVVSSEPDDGDGDGTTEGDFSFSGLPGDLTVELRAERSGKGPGRTYTITVECVDDVGNATTVVVEVPVAHDNSK